MKPKQSKKISETGKIDLKDTGPFTPEEAAKRVALASQLLKGFQLWHPHLHVAYCPFSLDGLKYPIPADVIPRGIVISEIQWIGGDFTPSRRSEALIQPFRNSQKTLAQIAEIHISVVIHEKNKKCPPGIHSIELVSTPGSDMQLQAYWLHDATNSPESVLQEVEKFYGSNSGRHWVVAKTYDAYIQGGASKPETKVVITFPHGEFDDLGKVLEKLLERLEKPKRANWHVLFDDRSGTNFFYKCIYDSAGRWFYFPKPEALEATGLSGNVNDLFRLVNDVGFPGTTANLRFYASFEQLKDVQAFFEFAERSEECRDGIDRSPLAMFETERGIKAQYCFGIKRGGGIFLKVLYAQPDRPFGWEDAYEKLLRGEKLI